MAKVFLGPKASKWIDHLLMPLICRLRITLYILYIQGTLQDRFPCNQRKLRKVDILPRPGTNKKGVRCLRCNGPTSVVDSRYVGVTNETRRRRKCMVCGQRYTTHEGIALSLTNTGPSLVSIYHELVRGMGRLQTMAEEEMRRTERGQARRGQGDQRRSSYQDRLTGPGEV